MKKTVFTGAGVAIITPMYSNGSINYEELAKIIEFQIENKTDAIIVCGTTGESPTMSDDEHIECVRFAVQQTAGRIPVIAGAGSNDTNYAVWLSKEAKKAEADALLHVTPYYNKCSPKGLVKHFETIADSTDLPVILYNVPSRTGMTIKPETYLELSKHPNIVATKEASGDISLIAQISQLCGDDLAIYSGNDDQIVPIMSLGGIGVISVFSNICPRQAHDICDLYLQGRVLESTKLQLEYLELINTLFVETNPMPIKYAMNLLGYQAGGCRLPLDELLDSNKDLLKNLMKTHHLI